MHTSPETQVLTEEQILNNEKLVETVLQSSDTQTPLALNEVASWLDKLESSED